MQKRFPARLAPAEPQSVIPENRQARTNRAKILFPADLLAIHLRSDEDAQEMVCHAEAQVLQTDIHRVQSDFHIAKTGICFPGKRKT